VRVKVCGVNSPAAFDAAAEAGADWVGFVFFAGSPRHVTPAQAALLSGRLVGGPARIGLFVDPSDDEIAEVLDRLRLHALQLYAPPARIGAIRARFGVPVWRALAVADAHDLPEDGGVAAALVIEPPAPRGAGRPGGNAAMLSDWSLLAGWQPVTTWLLAGGLTPQNVGRAVAESGAAAVDVSSGVESAPGVKEPALIAAFVAAARATG
jgi:phosphoribosylanthranilate isomerase